MNILRWLFGSRSLVARWLGYYRSTPPAPVQPPVQPSPTPMPPTPAPRLPPKPSRDAVCGISMHFQGLHVETSLGLLPWFGACLAWLSAEDRSAAYAAMRAAGDTHCIIHIPSGVALYDEPGQPYSKDHFPPLDWTAANTAMDPQFAALVIEVIQAGFVPMIFLNGDGADNYPVAMTQLPLVVEALRTSSAGDLVPYALIVPGWDSVFYGWEPSKVKIPAFGAAFRTLAPDGYLAIEHNIGHIPLGEGPSDWTPGGLMKDYDVLLGEFGTGRFDDTVWQVLARCIGPAYRRPAEQPAGDDPHPPFYLQAGSTRGPFFYCAFEFAEYEFVRGLASEQVERYRRKFLDLGCQWVG